MIIPSGGSAKALGIASTAVARIGRQHRRTALSGQPAGTAAYRLVVPGADGAGKAGNLKKLKKMAADLGITTPDVTVSYAIGKAADVPAGKAFGAALAHLEMGPVAVHAIFEKMEPPAELPNLKLIRGVEAVEYKEGMSARAFWSR